MPKFTLSVETTSNSTAGAAGTSAAIQMLMPAGRNARLISVRLYCPTSHETDLGRWVIDRISAVSAGSALTLLEMDGGGAASAISNATQSISTTLACANTNVEAAVVDCMPGFNEYLHVNLMTGVAQGFALRRATAPSGARVVCAELTWEE